MAASESCNMGPEAVTDQVDVVKRHVGGFLLKDVNKTKINDNKTEF